MAKEKIAQGEPVTHIEQVTGPKPSSEKPSKEVTLNRLDAIGGTITLPNKAAADRLIKLEEAMGVKNYEYPANGNIE